MPITTVRQNSWTSGEIMPDAWDRDDIQPIGKGCALAQNLLPQITGGLRKRRGFWYLGEVQNMAKTSQLVPFRRSETDALMLEFGDSVVRVWSADGSPLLNAGAQVTFSSPYAATQLPLRFKQVADVIYLRTAAGAPPQALERITDTSWQFNAETYTNGPWLAENTNLSATWTFTGEAIVDQNPSAGTGGYKPGAYIPAGQTVTITAAQSYFTSAMVGDAFRIREGTGSPSVRSWYSGYYIPVGWFILSVGNVYICTATAGSSNQGNMSTPPVHLNGTASDGCNTFQYLHDGSGIVKITAVSSPTSATGLVITNLPVNSGEATYAWSQSAYGNANGWPRAWPSVVEERLVGGATAANLDFLDLTRTAGFYPDHEDFHPGQGTGQVVDTDAVRRRLGDDGGEILWTIVATFLMAGTPSGEYVISGGLFGEPITPSTVICRRKGGYGSADVYPALVDDGIIHVCRGGQTLRSLKLDLQMNVAGRDLSFLAQHLSSRGMVQLAWLPQPDFALWIRLADGGLCVYTLHEEQNVEGWTTQALPEGWICEDIVTLPGPGLFETLWLIVSNAATSQRCILMQSQVSDGLFMDFGQLYQGAATTTIGGLGFLAGQTVRCLANGAQIPDQVVTSGGAITLPAAATTALVGLPMQVAFETLKFSDPEAMGKGTLNMRQRPVGCLVSALVAQCQVGAVGGPTELFDSRTWAQVSTVSANRAVKAVTLGADTARDPRLRITESTGYDFCLYSIRTAIETNAG